ncbi:16S rRNA (adenine(1518)-N(6)/adenine(1519)-N(6))-dimethyltransferase RsmA [Amphibiibacter pelophylacis]|uniref:16S rRNA (Adenine(1518)-N(6)/adenine(1519)-N(6))-dimethyltransferase RsmA n=1 Tax=Amphibiibacter pelophylacis TaxID=1799477 RepID=A0ACC6NZI6_9BURK
MSGGHRARKRFGQHFLTDTHTIDAIVRVLAPQRSDPVVEIGPGLGALTGPLLDHLDALTVVELDRDLAQRLRGWPRVRVIESDVLQVDFSALATELGAGARPPAGGLNVIGNLPYNVSTPILFHLLEHVGAVRRQVFMLQDEVIERMVAPPGSSEFGRLSAMLQWRYRMDKALFVPPEAFDPPPRVDSAVVLMQPRSVNELGLPPGVTEAQLQPVLQAVLAAAFAQRRKLLRHSLGTWLAGQGVDTPFDLQRRAQEVDVAEYVTLAAQVLTQRGGAQPPL